VYVKLTDWEESTEPGDLREMYPNKKTIEIYCNNEVKKELTEDVILEMAVDNILDYYDEHNWSKK